MDWRRESRGDMPNVSAYHSEKGLGEKNTQVASRTASHAALGRTTEEKVTGNPASAKTAALAPIERPCTIDIPYSLFSVEPKHSLYFSKNKNAIKLTTNVVPPERAPPRAPRGMHAPASADTA